MLIYNPYLYEICETNIIKARQGCTVVVPFREEMTKRHLKVTGDLGRVVFVVRNTPVYSTIFERLTII